MSLEPAFVDPDYWDPDSAPDFEMDIGKCGLELRSYSPLVDAGDFLTRTTSAGSGKTISVQDADYFCDGWDMIEGYLIQLEGQSVRARVLHADYDADVIIVDKSLTWSGNLGVSLAYLGLAPDIGADEYDPFVLLSDTNDDGVVDFKDFAAIVDSWNVEKLWPTD